MGHGDYLTTISLGKQNLVFVATLLVFVAPFASLEIEIVNVQHGIKKVKQDGFTPILDFLKHVNCEKIDP